MEEKVSPDSKRKALLDFLKLMKIDLVIVLFSMSVMCQSVTVTQLAEYKMCINQLFQPKEYCLTLTTNHSTEQSAQLVLQHANIQKKWQTIITSVPATTLAGFLGYWLDKYPQYFRMMLIIPISAACIEIFLMLINSFFFKISSWAILVSWIPFGLGGGYLLVFGAAYTYISWSTPTHLLIIRFAVLEGFVQFALLFGTFISGYILGLEPWFEDQPENYLGILSLSFILALISLILALTCNFQGLQKPLPENANIPHIQVLKDVFKPIRLKTLLDILFKKRPQNGRARLIALVVSATLCLATTHGEDTIGYQYAQSVYGWSAEHFTRLSPVVNIVPAIMTAIGPQMFSAWFKLPDTISGMIGCLSIFAMNLIRGSILNATGFALCYAFGSLSKIAVVSLRSLITVLVDHDESAKIFTIITTLDCYTTLGTSVLYTSVFNATMGSNPGLIYKIAALILLFPIGICVWLQLTRKTWDGVKPFEVDQSLTSGKSVMPEEKFSSEVREHSKSQNQLPSQ